MEAGYTSKKVSKFNKFGIYIFIYKDNNVTSVNTFVENNTACKLIYSKNINLILKDYSGGGIFVLNSKENLFFTNLLKNIL